MGLGSQKKRRVNCLIPLPYWSLANETTIDDPAQDAEQQRRDGIDSRKRMERRDKERKEAETRNPQNNEPRVTGDPRGFWSQPPTDRGSSYNGTHSSPYSNTASSYKDLYQASLGSTSGRENPVHNTTSRNTQSARTILCCLHEGCEYLTKRQYDLDRHKLIHSLPVKKFDCTGRGCGRYGEYGFDRKDHLREHLRKVHAKDIPKESRERRG